MASAKLFAATGDFKNDIQLPALFDQEVNKVCMYLHIKAILNNNRQGTAQAKNKSSVSGGGQKPWKQKGTGRARAGLKQSPVWRGGGVAFGPKPRDFSVKVNKKVAKLAFRRILSDRVADGTLILVEDLSLEQAKTKALVAVLKALKAENALLVVAAADEALTRAARNLPDVEVATAAGASAYQMMVHGAVVVTRPAWEKLKERLAAPAKKETVA